MNNGNASVQVQYEDGTFWLSQKRMAKLSGMEILAINYHLKAILSVGYRVSKETTHFRLWTISTLDEFVTKGFVLDKERLKQRARFGKDHFDDLLEQIRGIRARRRQKSFIIQITRKEQAEWISYRNNNGMRIWRRFGQRIRSQR